MDKTITIRIDRVQDEALTNRARLAGKTKSALVREFLERALSEQTVEERADYLKGSVHLKKPSTDWGRQLKKRNWR